MMNNPVNALSPVVRSRAISCASANGQGAVSRIVGRVRTWLLVMALLCALPGWVDAQTTKTFLTPVETVTYGFNTWANAKYTLDVAGRTVKNGETVVSDLSAFTFSNNTFYLRNNNTKAVRNGLQVNSAGTLGLTLQKNDEVTIQWRQNGSQANLSVSGDGIWNQVNSETVGDDGAVELKGKASAGGVISIAVSTTVVILQLTITHNDEIESTVYDFKLPYTENNIDVAAASSGSKKIAGQNMSVIADAYRLTLNGIFATSAAMGATTSAAYFRQNGLYFQVGGPRYFAVQDLRQGDRVQVVYKEGNDPSEPTYDGITLYSGSLTVDGAAVSSGSVIDDTGETIYEVSEKGDLTFSVHRYVWISSITITRPVVSASIYFPEPEYSVDIEDGADAFTAPTPVTVIPEGGSVAYSSDNGEVATVDAATGRVTLVANGTAHITGQILDASGNAIEEAADTYTLNVYKTVVSTVDEGVPYAKYGEYDKAEVYDFMALAPNATVQMGDIFGLPDARVTREGDTWTQVVSTIDQEEKIKYVTSHVYDISRFAFRPVSENKQGWGPSEGRGLLMTGHPSQGYYFILRNLHIGDMVMIEYNNNLPGLKYEKVTAQKKDDEGNFVYISSDAMTGDNVTSGEVIYIRAVQDLWLSSMDNGTRITRIVVLPAEETGHIYYNLLDMSFNVKERFELPDDLDILTCTLESSNDDVALVSKSSKRNEFLFKDICPESDPVTLTVTAPDGTVYTRQVVVYATSAEFVYDYGRLDMLNQGVVIRRDGSYNDLDYSFSDSDYNDPSYGKNGATVVMLEDGKPTSITFGPDGWRHMYPLRDGEGEVVSPVTPLGGTFYVFKPKVDGYLQFGGVKNNPNTVVLQQVTLDGDGRVTESTNVYTIQAEVEGDFETGDEDTDQLIPLTAGQTYYLYGNIPGSGGVNDDDNTGWSVFRMRWFNFFSSNSGFALADDYAVAHDKDKESGTVSNATTVYGVTSAPTITSVSVRGNISDAEDKKPVATVEATDVDGVYSLNISNINFTDDDYKGGAIRVGVSDGVETKYFTLTIPYGRFVWNFRAVSYQDNGLPNDNDLKEEHAKRLAQEFKYNEVTGYDVVRTYEVVKNEGNSGELKNPVLVTKEKVAGDNAFYVASTAGLIFLADEADIPLTGAINGTYHFGVQEVPSKEGYPSTYHSSWESQEGNYNLTDPTQAELFDNDIHLAPANTEMASLVEISGNGTRLIIPGLKQGWYVRIWWHQHGGKVNGQVGNTFTTENLTDLNGKYIDYNTTFSINGTCYPESNKSKIYDQAFSQQLIGNAIFKVSSDGDVAIVMKDLGYCKIYKIEVADRYETDMRLVRVPQMVDSENTKNHAHSATGSYEMRGSVRYAKDPIDEWPLGGGALIDPDDDGWDEYRRIDDLYYRNAGFTHEASHSGYITFDGTASNIQSQNADTPKFSVTPASGTDGLYYTTEYIYWTSSGGVDYNDFKLEVTKGQGNLLVTQEIEVGNNGARYVIDKTEDWIAIGQYTQQTYPYTWDFTEYNMSSDYRSAEAKERGKTVDDINAATMGSDHYGEWVDAYQRVYMQDDYTGLNAKRVKPLFANHAELSTQMQGSDNVAIPETQGLRITELPYYNWKYESDDPESDFPVYVEEYMQNFYNKVVLLDGDKLHVLSGTQITIPEVDEGMYVFVKCSQKPSVTWQRQNESTGWRVSRTSASAAPLVDVSRKAPATGLSENDDYTLAEGVYLYKVNEKGDVVLSFYSDTEVYMIGVTNYEKLRVNQWGKMTDSRYETIDYSNTEDFTGYELQPYYATDYTEEEPITPHTGKVTFNPVAVADGLDDAGNERGVGLVLHCQNIIDGSKPVPENARLPLFVPAVNIPAYIKAGDDNDQRNLLRPAVEGHTFSGTAFDGHPTHNYYVYTNQFRWTDGNGVFRQGSYGFYRLADGGSEANNTMGEHLAYLDLSSETVTLAPQIIWVADIDETAATPTAIDGTLGVDEVRSDEVWYSLDGIRLKGRPARPGIYLRNGKKVQWK